MIGIEFKLDAPAFQVSDKTPAIQVVNRLHEKRLLTVPAATAVVRLLPALNLTRTEAEEGLRVIQSTVAEMATPKSASG
jgi:acetylornithine/succinyldiaminopimelate/putrescine aminotransferase